MKYILITVENSDQTRDIADVLLKAEEEGTLDFAFNVQSFNSAESILAATVEGVEDAA
jgi:hypothetical protein